MRTKPLNTSLVAAFLLIGTMATATAQTAPQDPHHPEETQGAPAPQPAVPGEAPAAGMPGMMGGTPDGMPDMMGMMTPEMMQMMHRMRRMQAGDSVQRGMMMDPAMMMCPTTPGAMGMRPGAGMRGMMGGGLLYGMSPGAQTEMTPERVRVLLGQRLAAHANPRLRIGEIATAADGSITAEIVTLDGSLVQKLAFNRYPGLVRQITE